MSVTVDDSRRDLSHQEKHRPVVSEILFSPLPSLVRDRLVLKLTWTPSSQLTEIR